MSIAAVYATTTAAVHVSGTGTNSINSRACDLFEKERDNIEVRFVRDKS